MCGLRLNTITPLNIKIMATQRKLDGCLCGINITLIIGST